MSNEVNVDIRLVRGCGPDLHPVGEGYYDISVWDDQESASGLLCLASDRVSSGELASVMERMSSDQLGLIAEYGGDGHYASALDRGAYFFGDLVSPGDLTEDGE